MEKKKSTYLAGALSAIATSSLTYFAINAIFSLTSADWCEALSEPAWFAWVLAIAIFLVPMITGVVCGYKGCSSIGCFGLTIGMEIAALIVSFVIGFFVAILSVLFENVIGIAIVVSLFIAFTATPVVVIAIIE